MGYFNRQCLKDTVHVWCSRHKSLRFKVKLQLPGNRGDFTVDPV